MDMNRLANFLPGMFVLSSIASFVGRQYSFLMQPNFVRYGPQYRPKRLTNLSEKRLAPESGDSPRISIVIPSFNQGSFLERTLESLVDQKYPSLEIIVADGGSTDGSVDIVREYSDHIAWWCSEQDSGQAHGLNKGFSRATGEILAWLNADDRLVPGTLGRVAEFFTQNPDADAVYGHRILIDENDMEIGRWILPPHDDRTLTWADFVPQESLFWRRRMWESVEGGLNECYDFAIDWELLLRFRDAGAKIVRLPYFMGLFRIHAAQKTSSWIQKIGYKEMQSLRIRCLGYSPSDYKISLSLAGYLFRARIAELLYKAGLLRYD